jgi:nitrogen fixation/metabolism regulation signal transduction histidine kinase
VVATPRTELDAVIGQVRRFTIVIGAAALLVCLTAALALSARIARPVRELARGARRVAGGDLSGSVEVASVGEVRDLARAFNQMTEELRSSRDRLIQAERVAAWREMARRLAHELKNPLFPIQLSIETLERASDNAAAKPEAGEPGFVSLFRESSHTILAELRALRKVIDEFSEFARMPRPQPRPVQVNDVVERVLGLYQARSGAVQVRTRLDPDLPEVDLDPDLLARALGNLVANALESMQGAGSLELRTGRTAAAVTIAVEDSGPGLTEEQRSGLFSPYFTTKEGGTGLGLAIVQGIVSDHGGRVEVSGEPGRGTTFTLVLPAPRVTPDS